MSKNMSFCRGVKIQTWINLYRCAIRLYDVYAPIPNSTKRGKDREVEQ